MNTTMPVKIFVIFSVLFLLFSTVDVITVAEANTKIKHSRVKKAWVGERFDVTAKIKDDARIDVARVYFKSATARDYNFIPMRSRNGEYEATLPAPSTAGQIEYLILVKNGANEVRKTKPFSIKVKKSRDRAATAPTDQINVYTELPEAPSAINGFSDNIAIDVVESSARFGVVAGLYGASTAGGAGAGSVNATNAGLASTAGAGGAAVGVGLAAVAVGGVAVAASGGDDSGSDGGGSGGGGDGSSGGGTGSEKICVYNYPSDACDLVCAEAPPGDCTFVAGTGASACGSNVSVSEDFGYTGGEIGVAGACIFGPGVNFSTPVGVGFMLNRAQSLIPAN